MPANIYKSETLVALSGTFNDEGFAALNEGRHELALQLFHAAKTWSESAGDTEGEILALQNQYHVHRLSGRVSEALSALIDALDLVARCGDRRRFNEDALRILCALAANGHVRWGGVDEYERSLAEAGLKAAGPNTTGMTGVHQAYTDLRGMLGGATTAALAAAIARFIRIIQVVSS